MFGRRKLKAEIVRLSYRVSELEERLCPCESHSWVVVDSDFTVGSSAGDIDTINTELLLSDMEISAAGVERR